MDFFSGFKIMKKLNKHLIWTDTTKPKFKRGSFYYQSYQQHNRLFNSSFESLTSDIVTFFMTPPSHFFSILITFYLPTNLSTFSTSTLQQREKTDLLNRFISLSNTYFRHLVHHNYSHF